MRIDILGLQAFLSIAERGSFQRAAAHLNLSQTALSHRMRKFEADLGVKLFSRTTRQVTLSPAGLELQPKARRILDEIESSFESLRRSGRQRVERIAIGCLPTLAHNHLPGPLREFAKRFPDTAVKVHDNSALEIAELVRNGTAEFGVSIVSTDRIDLDIRPLATESFVLVCPVGHAYARRTSVDWAELEGQALVRISPQAGNRALIDDALGSRRESLRWRYEVQHVATAIGMVGAGLGLAIAPRFAVDAAGTPAVAAVALRNPSVSRPLGILSRRGVAPTGPAEILADLIAKSLKTRR